MKRITLVLFALAISLVACAEPSPAPVVNEMPVPAVATTEIAVEPQGKLSAPSFESQTYIDEAAGFALDYPASWTVKATVTGERASQSVLLSKPEIADLATLPEGETRVAITVNQWDPKNDLAAFVDVRKIAWGASGFTILDEEPLTLDLGLAAVRFTVQTPEGFATLFQFAAIGDGYLSISGEGDLELVKEIMDYLRPVGVQ